MLAQARSWFQAARPLAHVNIAVPLLFGQALAFAITGEFELWILVLVQAAGLLDQLFIVFANDVADEAGDRTNRTYNAFSGGSRVLVDGLLSRRALARGAVGALVGLLALAGATAVAFDRPGLLPLWSLGALLLWAYSFPPLRLSYRGWGELGQGLGVGLLLPLLGFYAQAGQIDDLPWLALLPSALLAFTSNVVTALPDAPADVAAGKQSWPVRFGSARARGHAIQLTALAIFMTPWVVPDVTPARWALLEGVACLPIAWALRVRARAEPENARACWQFVFSLALAANLAWAGWSLSLIQP